MLTRVYTTRFDFSVQNPFDEPATIQLRARRIDIPPDWSIQIIPASVFLGPGEQRTVGVTIDAGAATRTGTRRRVGVEGYGNGELIGGVALDVIVLEDVELASIPASTGFSIQRPRDKHH